MSSMLEQAIVDANTLREAAIKSAESNLVEKYSDQIKEAVENLLGEQEDPLAALLGGGAPPGDMGMGMPPMPPGMGMDMPADAPPDSAVENIPLGATGGEKLCPCPDEEEIIVIPLDDLVAQEEEIAPEDAAAMGAPLPPDMGMPPMPPGMPMGPPPPGEEPVMMAENQLYGLAEGLKVDVDEVSLKSGWMGLPDGALEEAEALALAKAQDDKVREELEELRAAIEKLQESNQTYEKYLHKAKKQIDFYKNKLGGANNVLEETKEVAYALHGKVQESNLANAKLLYTNKVLLNNSLNERQKTQIVENLTMAKNVEETKTIYETLQSAVGSTVKTTKKQPESLSEVMRRSSTTMLPRKKEEAKNLSVSDRWKALAGIK